ncbi:MAG: hypothetical protein HGA78_11190 [Nitrospirales bacterium]|nr:hypothetical protein [Nitrospirales bacterium]
MGRVEFISRTERFSIMNPFNNFAVEEHLVEVRRDPLLGDTSIYNPFLKDKARAFFGENDHDLIRKIAEETDRGCIFCPEAVETKTAKYPAEIIPEGRIRKGEAVLFANLFSVGKYHPVIAMSKAHFLKPSELTPEIIGNGFRAAQEFLKAVCEKDASAQYITVNANYLLPAGASLIHPHMQMLITPEPYSYQRRLLEAADRYYEENGSSWFTDLIDEEKRRGSRYIARTGNWHWMTAFSPMGTNEVIAVHEETADFGLLSNEEITALASGISRVLSFYEDIGHMSFNYTLFSTRESAGHKDSRCLFKIITRQNLYPNYRNDDYFLQKLLQSELIFTLPEELAEGVRERW